MVKWKTYSSTKPSILWWQTTNSKKILHILEVSASGVEVGDIEQVIVQTLLKYDKITLNWWGSTKFCDDALKQIMNSRNI